MRFWLPLEFGGSSFDAIGSLLIWGSGFLGRFVFSSPLSRLALEARAFKENNLGEIRY